jgi:hypothetical protein
LNIFATLAMYKVLLTLAERALAATSSSSGGIDSIANPPLNSDLGTIIALPGETFGKASRHITLLEGAESCMQQS